MKPDAAGAPAVGLIVRESALRTELVAALSHHYGLLLARRWEELAIATGLRPPLALADAPALAEWEGARPGPPRGAGVRVMALVHRAELDRTVHPLLRGVDDFIVHPFVEAELLARVDRLLRAGPGRPDECRVGPFWVDLRSGEARRGADRLLLTRKEAALLFALAQRAGRTVPRDELLNEVWGADADSSSNVLDACIRSLRRKVEPEPARPQYIRTVRGIGYRLHVDATQEGAAPAEGEPTAGR